MKRPGTISESDLLAYVDGQLPVERRAEVDAHLTAHPDTAEEVRAWQRQNEALAALYGNVAAEPLPDRLSVHGLSARNSSPAATPWLRLAASVMLLLGLGAGAGWTARSLLAPAAARLPPLVDEAVAAHSLYAGEVVHPVEVRADSEAHLRKWLSKRLDRPLNVPDLTGRGYRLVGGRLLPAGDLPAAQFMYQNAGGDRVTLYVVPAENAGETNFRFVRLDKLEAFFWSDERIRCALVGDLPRAELQKLATAAYRQLG